MNTHYAINDTTLGLSIILLNSYSAVAEGHHIVPRSEVKVVAPIYNPSKVMCVGLNYKDHCEEQNAPVPVEPVIFNKFPSCIIGPTDDIRYPEETKVHLTEYF